MIKEFFAKIIDGCSQLICAMFNWAKTSDGVSAITMTILIITLFFLILTFQYAYRPYVGIIQVNSHFDQDKEDLTACVKIKNTGNIPANNTQTNIKIIHNSNELEFLEGKARFVLFPSQETSGNPVFHHVNESNLLNDKIDIKVEIKYELPIRFIFKIYTRKFQTIQLLRYDYNEKQFRTISGESI